MSVEQPTGAADEDGPQEAASVPGEAPTEKLETGDEAATEKLEPGGEAKAEGPRAGEGNETAVRESWAPHQPEVRNGVGILVASILASIALVASYIFAGGLDFKPTPVADPCDSRVWSDPTGLEDTAQQLALSTLDGAACDLGVSRETLTRALASDQAIDEFLSENDLSREQFDEAIKAGLERAVTDAENAGAIDPLVASGIRTAVQFLPVSDLIPLIQGASSAVGGQSALGDLLKGDTSALDGLLGGDSGLGGILELGLDLLGGGSGGQEPNTGKQGDLGQQLRDQLPPEIERSLPPGIEDQVGKQLQQQLESLLGP